MYASAWVPQGACKGERDFSGPVLAFGIWRVRCRLWAGERRPAARPDEQRLFLPRLQPEPARVDVTGKRRLLGFSRRALGRD